MAFMDYLTVTVQQIANPLAELGQALVNLLPGLIAAVVVGLIGYFFGAVLGKATEKLCDKLNLDKKLKQANLNLGGITLAQLFGGIIKWYVFVAFLGPAVNLVQLGPLTVLLSRLVLWAPNLIVGIIIVVFGFLAADWSYMKIAKAKKGGFKLLAGVTRAVILITIFMIALRQMSIEVGVASTAFLVILTGIVLALAIPVGMGLGVGFKPHAKRIVDQLMKGF